MPVVEIVAGVESGMGKISESRRNVVRAKVANLLVTCKPTRHNITKEESGALRTIKRRDNIMILPADKGGGLVVMDKEDYHTKVKALLDDKSTYRKLEPYAVPAISARLIELLRRLRSGGRLTSRMFGDLYPTTNVLPRFYGIPKTHKENIPLRPIVASVGTATNKLASFVAKVISPLVGQSQGHLKNSTVFHDFVSSVRLEENEVLVSFDVTALFTSVPTDKVVEIVKRRLEDDTTLEERTSLNVDEICEMLTFCLNSTYFVYRGEIYQQVFGAAMGSPVSAIVSNIFMEELEERALRTSEIFVRFWKRYVDDICTALNLNGIKDFENHLNSIEPTIRFTREEETNGCLPFLDLVLQHGVNGFLTTKVHRKPTSLGQYLNFRSSHSIEIKKGITKLLMRRAIAFSSSDSDRDTELRKVEMDLERCEYPREFVKKCRREIFDSGPPVPKEELKGYITIPYVDGISQAIRRVLRKEKIGVAFRTSHTIRQSMVRPKDPIGDQDQDGVVYRIPCAECPATYIGQTKRQLKERVSEHKAAFKNNPSLSAVAEHVLESQHSVNWGSVEILGREKNGLVRQIKEAIHIQLEQNTMNRQHENLKTLSSAWSPILETLKL